MILSNKSFAIYFGDKSDSSQARSKLRNDLQASSLTFLRQVHGVQGFYVAPNGDTLGGIIPPIGDILLTNTPGCALGVLTADCLPIIFYDHVHHSTAIAHAGWKGTVANIAKKTVSLMHDNFSTSPADLQVFFGPSAQSCCYEVGTDFFSHVSICHQNDVFFQKNKKTFFDNSKLNYLQLLQAGVVAKNIDFQHNVCTICNCAYHSFRRDGKNYGHQATVVVLK